MPSINAKKGNNERGRFESVARNPFLPMILGAINPGLGIAARLGQTGWNIGERAGYMFDNDPSTGFWRGTNAGQPLFQGARDNANRVGNWLTNLFGNSSQPGAPHNGAPSASYGYTPQQAEQNNQQQDRQDAQDAYNRIVGEGSWRFDGNAKPTAHQLGNLASNLGFGGRGTVGMNLGWRGYGGSGGPLGGGRESLSVVWPTYDR